MNTTTRAAALAALAGAAGFLLGGCSSCEMKGSPFYTGEYAVHAPGAETRRVNLWPAAYFRDPALSVLWPIFEHTEEHLAVRPLFSAYGDTASYWEYNALWPLCQADTRGRDYRIFPLFWGEGKRNGNIPQSYQVVFPLLWRYEDETCALFPLWISTRDGWRDGQFTERDCWLGWPLLHRHTGATEEAWHAALIGRYRYLDKQETYTGFPWPLLFSWRSPQAHGLFTPLYAYEASDAPGAADGWAALPLLLAWHRWQKDADDVFALLGLFGRHWSDNDRSSYLFPLCAYSSKERLLLTPLVGWDKPDARDPSGYWYPLTPLAGVRTGTERGGWLFPLFDHTSDASNDTYTTHALLLGYASHAHRARKDHCSTATDCGLFPLFSRSLNTFTNSAPDAGAAYAGFNRSSRQLLFLYSREGETACRALPRSPATAPDPGRSAPQAKPRTDCRLKTSAGGLFPLWSRESRLETRLDGSPLCETSESSLLLALYDAKREQRPQTESAPPLDYVRRRILWRLWHYERRNGDVSVDMFPSMTYDTRTDGFSKASFLWRFYRYERHPGNVGADLDLLFLPLKRAR
jgi:hypothetical protein